MADRPNILFFFADDMRYDTIAALGNSEIITPNLDALVANGVSFTNAHIPGGTNPAVCMPSRAMLNTGRFLFSLDDAGFNIPENHTLLGEALQAAGYQTFGTGKWHNSHTAFARSFTDGAEIYFGGMYDHWKVPAYNFDPTGEYGNVINDVMNPAFQRVITKRRADHITLGKHSTDLFAEACDNWLESYESEQPFYMYLSYMAPHDPRSMPQKYLDMYDIDKIELPPNFAEEHTFDFGVRDIRDEVLEQYPRKEAEIKQHILEYYAMITHLDDSIGQVVDSLRKTGKYENTIIIFAADNGLAVGQHGLMGKQSNYEHSIRVPLVIAGPGIAAGETRDSYVYLCDIYPSLCELIDIDIPESVDALSFKPVLDDAENRTREFLYAGYVDKVRSIKDYRYKIIEYKYQDLRKTQLFDLENDPWEMDNLYHDESMQPIAQELQRKLREFAETTGDLDRPEGKRFWTDHVRVGYRKWALISV